VQLGRSGWLLAEVANRFDVVAVGISYETAVVIGVVLGPQSRRVEYLGAGLFGCLEEGVHRGSIGRAECDVGLAEALSGCLFAEPEVGHWWNAVSDAVAEVHDSLTADRGKCLVVEGRARVEVCALDGKMIKHAPNSRAAASRPLGNASPVGVERLCESGIVG